jgi:hypothetical protein
MSGLAAAPPPAEWEAWACLAMGSAVGVGAVNFLSEYNKQAGWGGLRGIIATHRWNLLGLAILEAVTGIAATLIVVGLGVTKPTWLDEPMGWFLLGTVGPAIAAASIASVRVGGQSHDLGLALLYSPVRDMLLKPVDDAFFVAKGDYERTEEAIYRKRALARYDAGELTLAAATDALRSFGERRLRTGEEKQAITDQLTFIARSAPPDGPDKASREREQLASLVAFMVEKRFTAVLNGLCGKPTDDDRDAISVPAPPPNAATPSSSG